MNHAIEILMLKWNEYYKQYSEIKDDSRTNYYNSYESEDQKLKRKLNESMGSCLNAIVKLQNIDNLPRL